MVFHLLKIMTTIHLQLGSVPPNIRPYMYPYAQKSDIEHMIQEILEASIIQPSQSYFSSPIMMVVKKDGLMVYVSRLYTTQ